MNQTNHMDQEQGLFEEFKQIQNINIPNLMPQEICQQKFLFYIDLTQTLKFSETLFSLSINNNIQRAWQGGFLGEYQFADSKNQQQQIFCYYFNSLIENDDQQTINIKQLLRFRIFLQEFVSSQIEKKMKFVFHFTQKNNDMQVFQNYIIKYIYQILDGFFNYEKDIICLFNQSENQEINYCKISQTKIHFKKMNMINSFDIRFIQKLDEFLEYFSLKQDDKTCIGLNCQQYIQQQVNVVLREFEKELLHFQKDIQQLLEFPVNLNNEIQNNQNVASYLNSLKTLIQDTFYLMCKHPQFDQMVVEIPQIINKQRMKIIEDLNKIVEEYTQFEIYLQVIKKGDQPIDIFNSLLQFKFNFIKSDDEILQQLKKFGYNEDLIKKTQLRLCIDLKLWFDQFDYYLPQSLGLLRRVFTQQPNVNLNKAYVFVLGMTRVGKSTLLNILSNPDNIIINQDKKFDVKEKNKQILISHSSNSATFQMQEIEIEDFIFVDSPGLRDTYDMNRGINHYNIYKSISNTKKFILLLLIDAEKLQTNKNDLIDSITNIKQMFADEVSESTLQNYVFPVFTKIKNENTMNKIIEKWKTETMKDITDKYQLLILNVIKNAIDKNNYIKIYDSETYEFQNKKNQLEEEISTLKDKAIALFIQEKYDEGKAVQTQLEAQKTELKNLTQYSLSLTMTTIKNDLFKKCQNITNNQQNLTQQLPFKFQLTAELKQHINRLLQHCQKIYQHFLNIITNNFITKMLYDDTVKVDQKYQELIKLKSNQYKTLQDLPKVMISEEVKHEIDEMNNLNIIISNLDNFNYEPEAIDFKELYNAIFQLECVFNKVVHIYDHFQAFFAQNAPKYKYFEQGLINIFFLQFFPIVMIYMALKISKLLQEDLFVKEQEKEKKEKMKYHLVQLEYYKCFNQNNEIILNQ